MHLNPGQWYSKLKRMTSHYQLKSEQVIVENIRPLLDKDKEQIKVIDDSFPRVSNNYEPIDLEKIWLRPENIQPTLKANLKELCNFIHTEAPK